MFAAACGVLPRKDAFLKGPAAESLPQSSTAASSSGAAPLAAGESDDDDLPKSEPARCYWIERISPTTDGTARSAAKYTRGIRKR